MAAAKGGGRPGISFLVCPDGQLLDERQKELEKQFAPPSGSWQKICFWGDEEPDAKFWESLSQQGLFAVSRMVLVRHAENWPASVWKALSRTLSRQYDGIWPVFRVEAPWERGKPKLPAFLAKAQCFIFAQKNGWVWQNPPLAGNALRNYVEKNAASLGLKINGRALDFFCESTMPDGHAILNELEKLSVRANGAQVTEEMISGDSSSPEADAFALVRKLLAGDMTGVWEEISRAGGQSLLFFLIALLAREFRILWQICRGDNVRLYPGDAASKKNLAERLGEKGICEGFSALADAEWHVKSGGQTPEQALDSLIIKMMSLFGGKGANFMASI